MEHKTKYYLQIADNALILSHRLSEYCSRAPFLEEDLANSNVALDLLGMAESIYVQVAHLENLVDDPTGDTLVYRRHEKMFYNCILTEQPNTDFAHLMVRQFFMDCFHYYFFTELCASKDEFLKAVALKSLKEVTYHLRRSSEWMIRLGDGTEEANQKMQSAIQNLWKFTTELFQESETDQVMTQNGSGVNLKFIEKAWIQKVREICFLAKLKLPEQHVAMFHGKEGQHSEYLGHILCEMQFLPTKYPDAKW